MLELKVKSESRLSAALTSALTVRLKVLLLMQTKGVSTNPRFWGLSGYFIHESPDEEEGMRNTGTTPYRRVWMENLAYHASQHVVYDVWCSTNSYHVFSCHRQTCSSLILECSLLLSPLVQQTPTSLVSCHCLNKVLSDFSYQMSSSHALIISPIAYS